MIEGQGGLRFMQDSSKAKNTERDSGMWSIGFYRVLAGGFVCLRDCIHLWPAPAEL